MSTLICLVRHGCTDWNKTGRFQGRTDIPLNQAGYAQAQQTARLLAREQWNILISSDLSRARQTAQVIGDELALNILNDPRLRERVMTPIEGLTQAEVIQKHGPMPVGGDYRLNGMEPVLGLCHRAMSVMTDIARQYEGKRVIVVSHGGLISGFLRGVLGGRLPAPGKPRLGNSDMIRVAFHDGQWILCQ